MKNLLFVCEGNSVRSPTFVVWFKKNRPQYNVRSIGTDFYYPENLMIESLEWADVVYVMDISQEMFIQRRFPEFLKKVIVVGVSDQYVRESPSLFGLIRYWVNKNNL